MLLYVRNFPDVFFELIAKVMESKLLLLQFAHVPKDLILKRNVMVNDKISRAILWET